MRTEQDSIESLQQELKASRYKLSVIKMINDELANEIDLDKLLLLVATKAREIIQAETLAIPILDTILDEYTYKAAAGKNSNAILNQTFPTTVGMCGWVISQKKPLVLAKDLPWEMDNKIIWEEGMESALLVPLMARGEIIGGLSALGKEGGGSFTQEDFDLLHLFAQQISIAIDNAKIFYELSEEKDRTETTLDSIGDAVVATDIHGVIIRANPIACDILGWSVLELTGKPLVDVFIIRNSDTGKLLDDPVAKVLQNHEIVGMENNAVLTNRFGVEYQIAESAAPIFDDADELHGVILVFHDVTEERKLLTELRDSEQKHRRLIEHLGDEFFMFIQGPDGRINYISPSVLDCLGYTPEEYINNYSSYLTENEMNQQIQHKFNEALNGVKPEPYEIEISNKQGDICCLRVTETPVMDKNNQVVVIEGLIQNITSQRELEQSNRQSQKMEAIGQLSGGIAHDFNNQLGVVMGYLEMLKDNAAENSSESRWVETASKASQRCIDLTRNLLNFSRKKIMSQSVVNLNNSLLSMQDIIEHSITAAIKLQLDYDSNLWNVMIDDGEFQDVVLNIIINARDAMPMGGQLSILTENVSLTSETNCYVNKLQAGDYVKLSVIDSGTGMSKKTLERIFEPFFTTKPVNQGTGLGMPMVFGFINRIDGAIDVHSSENVGTRVDLYIPQAEPLVDTNRQTEDDTPLPSGSEVILLVEDEDALRELAEENLIDLGYRVLTAENAGLAIEILKREPEIDLLFSDVVMPGGMDGYQLAEMAKQMKPELSVLMATGYASQNNSINNESKVADVILYKPYSRSILAQRVRRVLDNRS